MTLWCKAWRESRVRFLVSIAVMIVVGGGFIQEGLTFLNENRSAQVTYTLLVESRVYGSMFPLLFVMLCLLLGLGGLLRERAAGTVAYTLALPVTRRQLAVTRAAMGILQVAALALLPALLVPTLSPVLLNESYPVADALRFSLRWTAWGAVFFAIGFLWSSIISGEYTAAVACVLTPFLYLPMMLTIAGDEDRWPAANFMEYMHGGRTNEIALLPLVVMTFACAVIVAAAAAVTARRDF